MLRTTKSFQEFGSDVRPKLQCLQTTNDVKRLTKWPNSTRVFLFLRILFHSLILYKTEPNSVSLVTQVDNIKSILKFQGVKVQSFCPELFTPSHRGHQTLVG